MNCMLKNSFVLISNINDTGTFYFARVDVELLFYRLPNMVRHALFSVVFYRLKSLMLCYSVCVFVKVS